LAESLTPVSFPSCFLTVSNPNPCRGFYVNIDDVDRITHMHIYLFISLAVDGGYKSVVELLVRCGAEVNGTRSVSGWSCLHQAVYKVIALNYNSNL